MKSLHCFTSARFSAGWALVLSALSLVAGVVPANAQASWAGQQMGSPTFGDGEPEQRPERKPEPLNDLRPDATPWRSDVMLDAMSAAIEQYQRIVDQGGWPEVPAGRMMRAGDEDSRVPLLRKRLRASGDMPAKSQYYSSETFDSELEEAVKRFQLRNGIRPTGRIERSVYAVLNTTAQERLDQLGAMLIRTQPERSFQRREHPMATKRRIVP